MEGLGNGRCPGVDGNVRAMFTEDVNLELPRILEDGGMRVNVPPILVPMSS